MQESIESLLLTIPYSEIREHAFKRLNDAKLLNGNGKDINFMVLEELDIFKAEHMKEIKQKVWDIVFRKIRKTLHHGVVDWTQRRMSEELMTRELDGIELGDAATA